MSDLRESGELEQDAHLILAVYRDHVYNPEADPSEAELLILKNRQGATGSIPLDWEGNVVRFRNSNRVLRAADLGGNGGGNGGGGAAFGGQGGYGRAF